MVLTLAWGLACGHRKICWLFCPAQTCPRSPSFPGMLPPLCPAPSQESLGLLRGSWAGLCLHPARPVCPQHEGPCLYPGSRRDISDLSSSSQASSQGSMWAGPEQQGSGLINLLALRRALCAHLLSPVLRKCCAESLTCLPAHLPLPDAVSESFTFLSTHPLCLRCCVLSPHMPACSSTLYWVLGAESLTCSPIHPPCPGCCVLSLPHA